MKKHILSFALVATIIGSIAVGCSSQKKAGGSDSTSKDTTKVITPDTTKKDTGKMTPTDTTKKPM
jgi:hypothetical protein